MGRKLRTLVAIRDCKRQRKAQVPKVNEIDTKKSEQPPKNRVAVVESIPTKF
jgi:hypothetical protein